MLLAVAPLTDAILALSTTDLIVPRGAMAVPCGGDSQGINMAAMTRPSALMSKEGYSRFFSGLEMDMLLT